MMSERTNSKRGEDSASSRPSSNQNAGTILLGIVSLIPIMLLFPLVTLSIHTAAEGIWKFLWWAAWVGIAITALTCIITVWFGPYRWLPRRQATKALASACVVIPATILMVSMWYLADYSHAYLSETDAREVVDVRIDQLGEVVAEDGVALVALRSGEGHIAPGQNASNGSASMLITSFNYGCHGVFVPRMCCDVGGMVQDQVSQCHNCSYWSYPDVCPGAELFLVAPLWHDAASISGRPAAVAFQSRTSLFETEAARSAWAAAQQATPPSFEPAFCRGGHLCAFVPRNPRVQAHWNLWHRGNAATVEQSAVGAHDYEGATAVLALARAQDLAAAQMQDLGRPGERVPLLWVPSDAHDSFSAWESRLAASERSGEIGTTLIYVAAGLFGVSALAAAIWTHGRACWESAGAGAGAAAAEPASSA